MKTFSYLKVVVAIAVCFATFTFFSACEKEELDDPTQPSAVLNLSATAGNEQVSLTWDAPADNGGSEITGYEVTHDNWANKVSKSATELSHTYTGLTNGTEYTFKVRAVNTDGAGAEASATATPTNTGGGNVSGGALINGVVWSTRNVGVPGTFVQNPEDYGVLYQWNKKDPEFLLSEYYYVEEYPNASTWLPANDPCPEGWRLPTREEILSLTNYNKVTHETIIVNGVSGIRITDKTNGNNIFLPYAGIRNAITGNLYGEGQLGACWSSMESNSSGAHTMGFGEASGSATAMASPDYGGKGAGVSVRPVKAE